MEKKLFQKAMRWSQRSSRKVYSNKGLPQGTRQTKQSKLTARGTRKRRTYKTQSQENGNNNKQSGNKWNRD